MRTFISYETSTKQLTLIQIMKHESRTSKSVNTNPILSPDVSNQNGKRKHSTRAQEKHEKRVNALPND